MKALGRAAIPSWNMRILEYSWGAKSVLSASYKQANLGYVAVVDLKPTYEVWRRKP
jgi:hypothetical protein